MTRREYHQKYYQTHKEAIREKQREYYQNHKEEQKARVRAWQKKHPEAVKQNQRRAYLRRCGTLQEKEGGA